MKPRLKPLAEQVIVITGASSGIGLATALKAARSGAAVVLVSRNAPELETIAADIRAEGGRAVAAEADVADPEALERVILRAVEAFGGFDAWINDAGVGVWGDLTETPVEEQRRLFETNYWGVVHGSLAAAAHLRARPRGGAIVNLGSILSDIASPQLGAYSASKHAVKAFTDALRMELRHQGAPISVTLVKPSSIATPFNRHARTHLDRQAKFPPPVYAPELVADAVLHAVQHPVTNLTVGGAGRLMTAMKLASPALGDRVHGWLMPRIELSDRPRPVQDNLDQPGEDGEVLGDQRPRRVSLYTAAHTHPRLAAGLGIGLLAGATAVGMVLRRRAA